jgi:hypothetical protein
VLDNQVTLITDRAQISTGGREEAVQLAEQMAAEAPAEEEPIELPPPEAQPER